MKWFCFKTSTGTILGKFYPLQLFRIKTFAHQRQRVLGGRAAQASGGTSEVDSGVSRAKSWGSRTPTHRPDGPRRHPRARLPAPGVSHPHGPAYVITGPLASSRRLMSGHLAPSSSIPAPTPSPQASCHVSGVAAAPLHRHAA